MTRLLLRGAEVGGELVDVRIADGRVAELGRALPRLDASEQVIAARGGALLPGLTDHHLHLAAAAADLTAVVCSPSAARDADELAAALLQAPRDDRGWIRGVRYHASVAGELNATRLDGLRSDAPVLLRYGSGARWALNTRAATALRLADADHPGIERGADGRPTGRLHQADAWLSERLGARPLTAGAAAPGGPPLAELGRRLADHGITAVTDAEPRLDTRAVDAVARAAACGDLPQRVRLLGAPLDVALPPDGPTAGPWRIALGDPGPHAVDDLAEEIAAAHRTGRPVAARCTSREDLRLLFAALDRAGSTPGDRIEHAAVVPAGAVPEIRRRGLHMVARPGLLADRGDDTGPGDTTADPTTDPTTTDQTADPADRHRAASLIAAGVPLGLSSDAPYGPLDPWAVMRAAMLRLTPAGEVAGRSERLTAAQALAGYLSPRTRRAGGSAGCGPAPSPTWSCWAHRPARPSGGWTPGSSGWC
ncbi:amidohydrolase family protein [Kitasatospora paranensis]|uniref:amidohydrolase family protein n=1 Tax=Kitasatospora paranensis TaxID=258053 RepID=UPI0031E61CFE